MDLTIIIVNWNTRELLKNCIKSIIENKDDLKIKIIVVDNNSKDGSAEMVEKIFPEVIIIKSRKNIGFGKGNNLALPYANTPIIFFLNPDTVMMKGTIGKMVDFMKSNPKIGAIGCKLVYPKEVTKTVGKDGEAHTLEMQWVPSPLKILFKMLFLSDKTIQKFKKFLPYHDPNKSGFVSFLPGACLMVRKEVLDKIGYFDERFFMYGEDYELCHRIKAAGWQLYYMSEVKIAHHVGGSIQKGKSKFSTLMMCESISKLMEKYHGKLGKYLYRIVIFWGSCFRLFLLFNFAIFSYVGFMPYNISKESFYKYFYMLKWSIYLEKPEIEE